MSTTERTVASLRDLVAGRVIALGDDDYDDARRVFAGQIDRHPAAIVRVTGPDDVARVIGLARETGAELAVRSGGHSGAGYGVAEGGLVIDVRDLRGFELDRDARTVWAGTGLTAAEYTAAAGDAGLVTGFGDTGSVGIGGITLGGGVGFLVRKHGLTIDDLLAAEIVTADGEIVLANEGSHPDLFWAIRGGGGNFGVATRFLFRLHPLEQIVGGMLFLPATADVVEGFMAASDKAPEELSTIANVMTAPPMPFLPEELVGTPVLMAFIVWAGAVEDGEKAVAPLRALAEPIADFVRPMTYPEMYMPEPKDYRPTAASFNGFLDELTAEDVATILERLPIPSGQMRAVQLRPLGGAMARVPNEATAFAHRDRPIMLNVANIYGPDDDPTEAEKWVAGTADALVGDDRSGYANFFLDEPDRVRLAYPGGTWDRLRTIKGGYDPTNLFHLNQNIPPLPAAVAPTVLRARSVRRSWG